MLAGRVDGLLGPTGGPTPSWHVGAVQDNVPLGRRRGAGCAEVSGKGWNPATRDQGVVPTRPEPMPGYAAPGEGEEVIGALGGHRGLPGVECGRRG